ncbi:nicotinamide riboside transporter PnuC [uncultured Algibacter sp.]|uniref:nicotinamide riboside transporter PnuC n=1 Tax=uncultured Algibacter sp. TaxID=298659 RepID=UPI002634AF2B|nr:nicotinamide riboside transporter PnuC [uncultured Algibacter sp.]
MDIYLEIIAVVFGLAYLVFLIKEKIICWVFGVLGSLTSIVLFYRTGLYSESILCIYYVLIGIYGFIHWKKSSKNNKDFLVSDYPLSTYLLLLFIGEILSLLLAFGFDNYTSAKMPYLDAHTTVFSFIASYLEAKKKLASWKFWIVINAVTIVLYLNRDLNYYTFLTFVYFVFSFVGYFQWKKKMAEKRV